MAKYKRFDNQVWALKRKQKVTAEEQVNRLAQMIYTEGLKRFSLENDEPSSATMKIGVPSRRQAEISKIKKDKKFR